MKKINKISVVYSGTRKTTKNALNSSHKKIIKEVRIKEYYIFSNNKEALIKLI